MNRFFTSSSCRSNIWGGSSRASSARCSGRSGASWPCTARTGKCSSRRSWCRARRAGGGQPCRPPVCHSVLAYSKWEWEHRTTRRLVRRAHSQPPGSPSRHHLPRLLAPLGQPRLPSPGSFSLASCVILTAVPELPCEIRYGPSTERPGKASRYAGIDQPCG